jgi:hypothetical protein
MTVTEKFKLYKEQYLHNIVTTDALWNTFNFGSMACRASGEFDATWLTGWEEILPYRRSIWFKNQGIDNDNATACQIELYFNKYTINTFDSVGYATVAEATANAHGLAYDEDTELFTLNTDGDILIDPSNPPDNMYLELKPFGPAHHQDISDRFYLSAVCTNVTWVAANTCTFDIATLATPYTGAEQVKQMIISNLVLPKQNNRSFHPPTFFQYETVFPTDERGIILNLGETFYSKMTHDICVWWRAVGSADVGATLVALQLR